MRDEPRGLTVGSDTLSLIDQLEQLVGSARRLPFSNRILVDEEAICSLIEDIRARLPQELREARWLLLERDRIIAEARSQAAKIVEEARTKVTAMTGDTAIAREAEQHAQEILDRARHVAREIRYGALEYADRVLGEVSAALDRALAEVRNSRGQLKIDR